MLLLLRFKKSLASPLHFGRSVSHVSFFLLGSIYLQAAKSSYLSARAVPLDKYAEELTQLANIKHAGFEVFAGVTATHLVSLFCERDSFKLRERPGEPTQPSLILR